MIATTRGGAQYLVSERPRHRWTAEEEMVFFQKMEEDERKLYKLILSYQPLGQVNVKKLLTLFFVEKEERPSIQRKLKLMLRYYEAETLSAFKLRSLKRFINEVTDEFRMLEAPRLWARFALKTLCDPKTITTQEECDFFLGRVQDPSYLAWAKKVSALGAEVFRKKNEFVEDNVGLVGSIIKRRYSGGSNVLTPFLDLQQEGAFGLIKAMDKFDYKRGLKFSTYASWWVRHSLSRAICDKDKMIRVPVHAHDKIARMRMFQHDFLRKNFRDPSVEEIMSEMKMTEPQVREMMHTPIFFSFDAKVNENDSESDYYGMTFEADASVADNIHLKSSFEEACSNDIKEQLREAIKSLTPKERAIIRGRFGVSTHKSETDETSTLKEIGDGYSLSRERIRQIETLALEKLRSALRTKKVYSPSDIAV